MEVSRHVLIDLSANTLLSFVSKIQKERRLSNEELELVVIKVLDEIRATKSLEYANTILNLTAQIQQLEKEKEESKEEENGESV